MDTKSSYRFYYRSPKFRFPVYLIDDYPEGFCETKEQLPSQVYACKLVPLKQLAKELRNDGIYEISISNHQHFFRYYHYKRPNADYYFFHNEEPSDGIKTVVSFPSVKPVRVYDVMENRMFMPEAIISDNRTSIELTLGQYKSILFIFGEVYDAEPLPKPEDGINLFYYSQFLQHPPKLLQQIMLLSFGGLVYH